MNALSLFIGSAEIPQTFINIQQTYSTLSARTDTRLSSGALVRRESWADKILTKISASGIDAVSLLIEDFSQPLLIKCIAPRELTQASNIITLPSERRSDTNSDPYGKAYVPGVGWVETDVTSLITNTLTLDAVAGATLYKGFYYPEFTGLFTEPQENSSGGLNTSWSISGQQV